MNLAGFRIPSEMHGLCDRQQMTRMTWCDMLCLLQVGLVLLWEVINIHAAGCGQL